MVIWLPPELLLRMWHLRREKWDTPRHRRSRRRRSRSDRVRRDRERGFATAETAAALPVLVFVVGAALWAVRAMAIHLECVDAAWEAARAASRGEPLAAVQTRVLQGAPDNAQIKLTRGIDVTRVEVSAAVGPAWAPGFSSLTVSAGAVVATEPGVVARHRVPDAGDVSASSPVGHSAEAPAGLDDPGSGMEPATRPADMAVTEVAVWEVRAGETPNRPGTFGWEVTES
ncbi:TadE family type IV pilus minor pilin [Rhizohabitans arisaemae]|uniref:TadE family type IV pilus minor pilin n=1 Tax=Rhizohabitans arisaemae TaxID=2720610 RepID=UPI0024B09F3B|nr:TadE family type IV pilus minor pilin [Rhizohabitans arisaemae]